MHCRRSAFLALFILFGLAATATSRAAGPAWSRVLADPDRIPADRRLDPPRRVTQGSDFKPYTDRAAWQARVRYLREKTLVAAGLWPMPDRCPLNAKVTAVIDRGDHTIENVYFASLPGLYITGSVYRPKGQGLFPAVLCPHGHARLGRLAEAQEKTRDGQPNPDPWPYQARGVALARLGCIALLYDMVGYADAWQIRHPTDSPKVRVPEGTDDFEGLEFEQYCLSTLGLQTWNSMRAVDYLLERTDVDAKRIAVSGGSGGATQTLMLMMTDERIVAAAPVCMVSTGFQGDCTCEQAVLGKIGTDTVELSAAFAPKPLLVVGATGDWTREIIEKGGPEIRASYELMGAADRVGILRLDAPHNYNRASREAVHDWFNRWLKLGHSGPIREQPFEPVPPARLRVFDDRHPRPADALDAAGVKRLLIASARRQLEGLRPADAGKLEAFRRTVGTALRHLVASELPAPEQVQVQSHGVHERPDFRVERLTLARAGSGESNPALLFRPRTPTGTAIVVVHPEGKSALLEKNGEPGELLSGLLHRGCTVLALDAFLTGEYHTAGKPTPAPDARIGFFASFNRTLLAQRVHDILTAIAYLRGRPGIKSVSLVGLKDAGIWCLLARGLCGDIALRIAVETGGFSFESVKEVTHPMYLPGALRYGDLPVLACLAAPGDLLISDAGRLDTGWLRDAYRSAGTKQDSERLRVEANPVTTETLLKWLLR
jgi:dienelactone hydrolase